MRPYVVLSLVVLVSVLAFGQERTIPPAPHIYGPCVYGCGPFVPLLTTPMVSLVTVSPNPVGASNATTGLYAGATNSTLSQIPGSTSSVYTEPVWYQGGDAPLITKNIHLLPEPIAHESHPMMPMMHIEHAREEAHAQWTYFSGSEHTAAAMEAAAGVKSEKKATRTYTNADVERQNQSNGEVKHNGKTEKL